MTNIFDTHSHYDDKQFNPDREELLKALPSQGVSFVVSCGCDIETTKINKILADKFDFFYFTSGFHPESLENVNNSDLIEIKELAKNKKCLGIGEIGLDYHWLTSTKETQIEFFEKQIEIAKELSLPIIVHDREAHQDVLDILKKHKPTGVLHCFSGSNEMAREIIKLGMYIGLNGVVTFKNARKSLEVVKDIPLERLVLETDCPYLSPEPNRGHRNDSSQIIHIAKRIAEVLDMDTQKLLDVTHNNAKSLYNLD